MIRFETVTILTDSEVWLAGVSLIPEDTRFMARLVGNARSVLQFSVKPLFPIKQYGFLVLPV